MSMHAWSRIGLGLLMMLFVPHSQAAMTVPKYQIGERATADVVTPVPLMAVNRARTERLRESEARNVPVIFRHDPKAAEEADKRLFDSITDARHKFRASLTNGVFLDYPLTSDEIASPKYQTVVEAFQRDEPNYPINTNQLRAWARGNKDDAVTAEWRAILKAAMTTNYIRPDGMPQEGKDGPEQIRVVPKNATNIALSVLERDAKTVLRTNLMNKTERRRAFRKTFPPEEEQLGRYLAGFLRVNCEYDETLTKLSRAAHTEALWQADRYQPGDVIVKAGQVVDAQAKAALDALQATLVAQKNGTATGGAQPPSEVSPAPPALQAQQAAAVPAANQNNSSTIYILIGGAAVVVIAVIGWLLLRRSRSTAVVPAWPQANGIGNSHTPAILPTVSTQALPENGEAHADGEWAARAQAAEAETARVKEFARAALDPQLKSVLKDKTVQALAAQRAELLAIQEKAEAEVSRLEELLTNMQAPQEARLRAFEQRIAELENQMAAQGAENRELLQAVIRLTRQKLDEERSRFHN